MQCSYILQCTDLLPCALSPCCKVHAVFIQSVGYHCCDMHMHSHVLPSIKLCRAKISILVCPLEYKMCAGDYSLNLRINMHAYANFWQIGQQ